MYKRNVLHYIYIFVNTVRELTVVVVKHLAMCSERVKCVPVCIYVGNIYHLVRVQQVSACCGRRRVFCRHEKYRARDLCTLPKCAIYM